MAKMFAQICFYLLYLLDLTIYGVRCIPNIAVLQPLLYPGCYRLQSTMTGNTSKCSTCMLILNLPIACMPI